MFGPETTEMKIARLESDKAAQIGDVCMAKRRLLESLLRDRNDKYPCGMVPGGETDMLDIRGAAAQIEQAAKHIEDIDRQIMELRGR